MPPDRSLMGNRFKDLDLEETPKSRKRKPVIAVDFPKLPIVTQQTTKPKFIHIKAGDEANSLLKLSVFAKKKFIDAVSTEIISISMLRDGSLLILTKSQKIADKFLKLKKFGDICPVNVVLHNKLNSCQGIIFDKNLIDIPNEELLVDLKDQGVTHIHKFSKLINNKQVFTGAILLTFDLYKLPAILDVAWYKLKVKEFFPNPMRCRNCQLLGHTLKYCQNNATCNTCNSPVHEPSVCTREMCANCHGPHPASSPTCPKYLQQKEILKIQTKEKCTIYDAKKIYFQNNNSANMPASSYSNIIKKPVAISDNNGISNINNSFTQKPNNQNKSYNNNTSIQTLSKQSSSSITTTSSSNNIKFSSNITSPSLSTNNKSVSSSIVSPSTTTPYIFTSSSNNFNLSTTITSPSLSTYNKTDSPSIGSPTIVSEMDLTNPDFVPLPSLQKVIEMSQCEEYSSD